MNKLSILALGTALALSAPFAVQAQDAGANVGVDAGVDAGADAGVEADADADAGAGADADALAGASAYTYSDLTTAIDSMAGVSLVDVDASTTVEIVLASELSDASDAAAADAFAEMQSGMSEDLETLRSEVQANSHVMTMLAEGGLAAEDVMAVSSSEDGTLTIFVDDRDVAGPDAEAGETPDAGAAPEADAGAEAEADAEAEAETPAPAQ